MNAIKNLIIFFVILFGLVKVLPILIAGFSMNPIAAVVVAVGLILILM